MKNTEDRSLPSGKTVTAERKTGFVVMAKPVGSVCNLRCRYCYYLDAGTRRKEEPHEGRKIMSDEVLENFIRQYFEDNPGPAVQFNWHGGEPTLAGLDFYKKVVALQKKYCPVGWEFWNNIQTNGLLLDDEWCAFLAENHFDIGFSIDGTESIHDRFRVHPDGSPSYEEASESILRLQAHGIQPDLLCTVTMDAAKNPEKVYRTLKNFHTGWIQFIPIVVREQEVQQEDPEAEPQVEMAVEQMSETEKPAVRLTPESVTPQAYGKFLCDIFDQWICHDLGSTDVQLFAETAQVLAGGQASLCTMAPVCGRVPVLEYDGNVYSCDHFVDTEHCLGNVLDTRISALLENDFQKAFGMSKQTALPGKCRSFPYLRLCSGGCLKDRFHADGSYDLCDGLRMYYEHAVPLLQEIMAMSRRKVPNGTIMAEMRSRLKKLGKRV